MLADHPDAEAELHALVKEIQVSVPVASDHSVAASGDVNVLADRGSVAAGVVHGDVNVLPGPTAPGPAGR